jgi:hypothetical protein
MHNPHQSQPRVFPQFKTQTSNRDFALFIWSRSPSTPVNWPSQPVKWAVSPCSSSENEPPLFFDSSGWFEPKPLLLAASSLTPPTPLATGSYPPAFSLSALAVDCPPESTLFLPADPFEFEPMLSLSQASEAPSDSSRQNLVGRFVSFCSNG